MPLPVESALDPHDRGLIRGLRPETAAMWAATAGSALFSILLYCGIWNVLVACGLVFGMWVHELGHLAVLRRLGLESAPIVFVPFIGATQHVPMRPARAFDGARLALAGPACGLLFAAACKLAWTATDSPVLHFLGTAHAILAGVDLLPFGMLDGGRIVEVLTRRERIICAAMAAALAILCRTWLPIPMCLALASSATRPAPCGAQPGIAVSFATAFSFALCLQL